MPASTLLKMPMLKPVVMSCLPRLCAASGFPTCGHISFSLTPCTKLRALRRKHFAMFTLYQQIAGEQQNVLCSTDHSGAQAAEMECQRHTLPGRKLCAACETASPHVQKNM